MFKTIDGFRFPGVYALRIDATNDFYVGKTQDVTSRFMGHLRDLRTGKHANSRVQECYDAYGEHTLSFILLEKVDGSNLEEREAFWMQALKPRLNIRKETIERVHARQAKRLNNPHRVSNLATGSIDADKFFSCVLSMKTLSFHEDCCCSNSPVYLENGPSENRQFNDDDPSIPVLIDKVAGFWLGTTVRLFMNGYEVDADATH